MTTCRDVLTGLAATPFVLAMPCLPVLPVAAPPRQMTIHDKLKAFYDDCAAEAETFKPSAPEDHRSPEFAVWPNAARIEPS